MENNGAMIDTLVFNAEDHTYHHNGNPVPSVTTLLEPYSNLNCVDPQILAEAAEFGTNVHDAVDIWNRGMLDEEDLAINSPLVCEYLEGWKKFIDDSGAVVIESECRVFSKKGYAGTLDSICAVNKTNRIYDVKTGSTVPKSTGVQLAAYEAAYREMNGGKKMRRYCVHLKPKSYNLIPFNDPGDYDIFNAILTVRKWQLA